MTPADLQRVAQLYGLPVEAVERVVARLHHLTTVCLPAAMENEYVQDFIVHGSRQLGYYDTAAKRERLITSKPPLRLVFEHGRCFTEAVDPLFLPGSWSGGKKLWGAYLRTDPLKPTDMYSPVRPGWVWTSGNDAFMRRMNLKAMLGPFARTMVEDARRDPLYRFLKGITPEKAATLQLKTGLTPHEFWRAVKGRPSKEPQPQQATLFPIIGQP